MEKSVYEKIRSISYPEEVRYPFPRMSMSERAAQFGAFKALTGYEDAVEEAARVTGEKAELDDAAIQTLNAQMRILQDTADERPMVTATYFLPDEKKAGGRYVTWTGQVRRVDVVLRTLCFVDGTVIPLDDLMEMDGDIFRKFTDSNADLPF